MMQLSAPRRFVQLVIGAAAAAALALLPGCGGPETGESTDADQVSALVSELADAARTAESFQALFAEGTAPPEERRPAYNKLMFFATASDVSISGDTAEVAVRVEDFNNNHKGNVTWKAKRQGQGWVLTEAPLP